MDDDRLRLLAPELSELLSDYGGPRSQLAACRLAATAAHLDDDRAAHALEVLSSTGPDQALAETSQQLADEYDEAAWAAQESGSEAEYASLFSRARAAEALACAHREDARDAIYEAAHAFDDPDEFTEAFRAALAV